ncbi:YraN family protein [Marinomonas mediterranea]|jgi:conserved hypothetical protein TIGR00252|uniref:UPF0102 protein Marme_2340 n=1 Tax=Marinomonas mediterranea (strain ATCC 700492 / JCM 21426 / NBRC 103028 / MMB-1) TaxID=717774 RepID=F2JU69_MARM1|nr:YraN family protein [Marinomonas mediterranea]ADZ91581.1 UPF0102 protein yraN [Marinomonas mediterranea MMB-1]WCN13622.1 YraN family protein [Marinomonas mediterranea]WCN17685.1 YraN family protein [Marinomonas mediterranea MMB-1]
MLKLLSSFKEKKLSKKHSTSGKVAEHLAAEFLERNGLTVIDRNFHSRYGEIDIICKEGEVVVFVEVKFRKNHTRGKAVESITPSKLSKILLTAQYWIKRHKHEHSPVRFDAVTFDKIIDETSLNWLKAII